MNSGASKREVPELPPCPAWTADKGGAVYPIREDGQGGWMAGWLTDSFWMGACKPAPSKLPGNASRFKA